MAASEGWGVGQVTRLGVRLAVLLGVLVDRRYGYPE